MPKQTGNQANLSAGRAAAELGVGVQTLHFYEREGLIPPTPRTGAGYRQYTPEVMERLGFIRRAQAFGLSLAEIKATLELAAIGESPCGRVQAALAARLDEVDRRLDELNAFRSQLTDLIARAPKLRNQGTSVGICSILDQALPDSGTTASAEPIGRRLQRK